MIQACISKPSCNVTILTCASMISFLVSQATSRCTSCQWFTCLQPQLSWRHDMYVCVRTCVWVPPGGGCYCTSKLSLLRDVQSPHVHSIRTALYLTMNNMTDHMHAASILRILWYRTDTSWSCKKKKRRYKDGEEEEVAYLPNSSPSHPRGEVINHSHDHAWRMLKIEMHMLNDLLSYIPHLNK